MGSGEWEKKNKRLLVREGEDNDKIKELVRVKDKFVLGNTLNILKGVLEIV